MSPTSVGENIPPDRIYSVEDRDVFNIILNISNKQINKDNYESLICQFNVNVIKLRELKKCTNYDYCSNSQYENIIEIKGFCSEIINLIFLRFIKKFELLNKRFSDLDNNIPYIINITPKIEAKKTFSTQIIAQKIFKEKKYNIVKIKEINKNTGYIQFLHKNHANEFLNDSKFLLDNMIEAYIPDYVNTCKVLIRDINISFSEETLLEDIQSKILNQKVLHVRRIKKKYNTNDGPKILPIPLIVVTFSGRSIPSMISLYGIEKPTERYIPAVTQCHKCLLYGHTKNTCKSTKIKCFKCGVPHSENSYGCSSICTTCNSSCTSECEVCFDENDCVRTKDCGHCKESCKVHCIFCKEDNHSSLERKKNNEKICQEFKRQQNIREIMAFRNISFSEASKICPPSYIKTNNRFSPLHLITEDEYLSTIPNEESNPSSFYSKNRMSYSQSLKNISAFNPKNIPQTINKRKVLMNQVNKDNSYSVSTSSFSPSKHLKLSNFTNNTNSSCSFSHNSENTKKSTSLSQIKNNLNITEIINIISQSNLSRKDIIINSLRQIDPNSSDEDSSMECSQFNSEQI